MRIGHVISSLDPAVGGTAVVATRLSAAQAALGHDVHLLSYTNPASEQRLAAAMARVAAFGLVRRISLPAFTPIERLTAWSARRQMRQIFPELDVVHLHGVWDPITRAAAGTARHAGVPYVLAAHGMLDPWSLRQKWLKKRIALTLGYRQMLDGAAFLHALNINEKQRLKPLRLRCPVELLPNGIFPDAWDPLPDQDTFHRSHPELAGAPYILFLSRLHYKKGLDYLGDAFALVAAKNLHVHLVVAGPDDGERARFEQRVQASRLADRVHVVGPLYGDAKLAAYAGASCFCLPSRQEGFSMAIIEALTCRLPVVISEQCHFPEVSEVGAGHVVPLEPHAIADALLRVLADAAASRMMGKAGRELVESHYTWPRIAASSIQAYQRIPHQAHARIRPLHAAL